MMRKALTYILTAVMAVLILAGCAQDDFVTPGGQSVPDGTPIDLDVTAEFPEMSRPLTRSMSEQPVLDDLKIHVLVFDEKGFMVQYVGPADIEVGPINTTDKKVRFKVNKLLSSGASRTIHFVVTPEEDLTKIQGGEFLAAMANETVVMPSLVVKSDNDAYWGMRVFSSGIGPGTSMELKMIRNFARATVVLSDKLKNSGTFTLESFSIVNRPDLGTIAPYVYEQHRFANFLQADQIELSTYAQVKADGYNGTTPAGIGDHLENTTVESVTAELDKMAPVVAAHNANASAAIPAIYFYERPQSQEAGSGIDNLTYMIVKGKYNGQTTYYHMDFGAIENGRFLYYDLIRNFQYQLVIDNIEGLGSSSVEEAMASVPHNNISASVVTKDLFSIGYNNELVEVNATYMIVTRQTNDIELKFRYVPGDGNRLEPQNLMIYDAKKPDVTVPASTASLTSKNARMAALAPLCGDAVRQMDITAGTDGWYTLTINTQDIPKDGFKEQTFGIFYKGTGSLGLQRQITLRLRKPWDFANIKTDSVALDKLPDFTVPEVSGILGKAVNDKVNLYFTLPSGMAKSMFPLTLTFESDKHNIYARPEGSLTVDWGKSLFKGGTTDNVIRYQMRIEWEEYDSQFGKAFVAPFAFNTTSRVDETTDTSGIDAANLPGRQENNGSYRFCIRIGNDSQGYLNPTYVSLVRQNP